MDFYKIENWEFDDNGNLIVELESQDYSQIIDDLVKGISRENFLSRPIKIKNDIKDNSFVNGYFFSIHEFNTIDLFKLILDEEKSISRDALNSTSRMIAASKNVQQVYIKRKPENVQKVLSSYKPLMTNYNSYSAMGFKFDFEKVLFTNPILKKTVHINSGEIVPEGYSVFIHPDDSNVISDLIKTTFPENYTPQSVFLNKEKTSFLFSRNEFDIYNLFQILNIHKCGEISILEIIANKLEVINNPKEWNFEGIAVPNDYEMIIDGKAVKCKTIYPKKIFNLSSDVKPNDIVTFISGVIGCVKEVTETSIRLAYYRHPGSGKFMNVELYINKKSIGCDGHLATNDELLKLQDSMNSEGYIFDPDSNNSRIINKFRWLATTPEYYIPEFKQDEYKFICKKCLFHKSKKSYIDLYESKTPIFENRESCQKMVDKYNSNL